MVSLTVTVARGAIDLKGEVGPTALSRRRLPLVDVHNPKALTDTLLSYGHKLVVVSTIAPAHRAGAIWQAFASDLAA